MKSGHTLEFRTLGVKENVRVRIREIRKYKTLEDALVVEDAEKIAPGVPREEMIKSSQERFKPENVQKYGLMALDFEKI